MADAHSADLNQILANMQADVILGKNVEEHYVELLELITHCNQKFDEAQASHNIIECATLARVGYELYRLKDAFLVALENNG
jgi:hypothetical protein